MRQRVVVVMKSRYKTVEEAEDDYGLTVDTYLEDSAVEVQPTRLESSLDVLNAVDHLDQAQLKSLIVKAFKRVSNKKNVLLEVLEQSDPSSQEHLRDAIVLLYSHCSAQNQRFLVNKWFMLQALAMGIDSNPTDFPTRALDAMVTLQRNGKPNLLYKWCQCLCNEKGEPSLDFNRMPFGMLQYIIEFFSCTHFA